MSSGEAPSPPASWKQPPEVEAILAIGSLALFAYVTWAVIYNTIPAENEKYAMLMLGALIGVVKDTFGRYFQSTKGAQEQRRETAQIAAKAAEAAATLATVQASGPQQVEVVNTPDAPVPVEDPKGSTPTAAQDAPPWERAR